MNTEVFPELQHWFFDQLNVGALTIDFDSTFINRCGHQEGSAKGYNPNEGGCNSHHPLMAFVSKTRMVTNAWLSHLHHPLHLSMEGYLFYLQKGDFLELSRYYLIEKNSI
ncbi:MAG: hypothetical protein AAF616_06515 [Bacteroidota bacterium]